MAKYKAKLNLYHAHEKLVKQGDEKTSEEWNELGFIPEKLPELFELVPEGEREPDTNGEWIYPGDWIYRQSGTSYIIARAGISHSGGKIPIKNQLPATLVKPDFPQSVLKMETEAAKEEIDDLKSKADSYAKTASQYGEFIHELQEKLATQLPQIAPFVEPKIDEKFWYLDTSFTKGIYVFESLWNRHGISNIAFNTEEDAQVVADHLNKVLEECRKGDKQ